MSPATFPVPIRPTGMPAPGSYPWDHWERAALAGGLGRELATLGRAVMREASQHGWCGRLCRPLGVSPRIVTFSSYGSVLGFPHLILLDRVTGA
jgi:hypothetical protein